MAAPFAGGVGAAHAPPPTPKPPGRRPFLDQFDLTPARDAPAELQEQAMRVEQMQKKIWELEELIKELLRNKGGGKDAEVDDEALKPLHSKDMKPPPEYGGGKKDF